MDDKQVLCVNLILASCLSDSEFVQVFKKMELVPGCYTVTLWLVS